MISRLIVRAVLITVIALLAWVGWLTWSYQFVSTDGTNCDALKVALLLVEGGILLAALSLLIETFGSFGVIAVKRSSWKSTFFGYGSYDDGSTVRTCELFAFRSVLLAMAGLVTAMLVVVFWEAIKFLLNPHAVVVNWNEVFKTVETIFIGVLVAGVLIGLGYGLFKLVGMAITRLSARFPTLREAYNTICPVQTIHFVE